METLKQAIENYFRMRNQMWIAGSADAVAGDTTFELPDSVLIGLKDEVKRKLRDLRTRRTMLFRSKSTVTVASVTLDKRQHKADVEITEEVVWLYPQGRDVQLESRVWQHRQLWIRRGELWHLQDAKISGEWLAKQVGWFPPHSNKRDRRLDVSATASPEGGTPVRGPYDRLRALRYADLWWNATNPLYPRLADDCTNFVSQCLKAGRIPVKDTGNRASGWWFHEGASLQNEGWSYSWAVTQALYQYLLDTAGAQRLQQPGDLKIGDLIFYDWDGRGRFHHATIVTDFDLDGNPLVNAHTDDSFHRPYLYLDSRAWTPNTQYAFLQLLD